MFLVYVSWGGSCSYFPTPVASAFLCGMWCLYDPLWFKLASCLPRASGVTQGSKKKWFFLCDVVRVRRWHVAGLKSLKLLPASTSSAASPRTVCSNGNLRNKEHVTICFTFLFRTGNHRGSFVSHYFELPGERMCTWTCWHMCMYFWEIMSRSIIQWCFSIFPIVLETCIHFSLKSEFKWKKWRVTEEE